VFFFPHSFFTYLFSLSISFSAADTDILMSSSISSATHLRSGKQVLVTSASSSSNAAPVRSSSTIPADLRTGSVVNSSSASPSSNPILNSPRPQAASTQPTAPVLLSGNGLGISSPSGPGSGLGNGNGNGSGQAQVHFAAAGSGAINVPPAGQLQASSHSSSATCEMTMKDLLNLHQDYDDFKDHTALTPLSTCPICQVMVGKHKFTRSAAIRIADDFPDNHSVHTHPAADQPDDDDDFNQAQVALSSVRSNPPRDFSRQFDKALSRIPPWSKNHTHASGCREFLEGVEYALEIFGVPQDQWYRILPLVFEKGDYASARYVKTHITGPHPISLDWDEAKSLFTSHFQRADFIQVIERDFGSCRQRPRESVQLYADRFMSYCEDLNIEDTSTQAISKFTNGLLDTMRKKYNNLVAMMEMSPHGAPFVKSLSTVVKACVKLDVADGSSADSFTHSTSTSTSKSNKLYCKFHPTSSTHSTADCRFGTKSTPGSPYGKSTQSPSTRPAMSNYKSSSPATASTQVKCYNCGESGHISPACPKRGSRPSTSSSSHASSAATTGLRPAQSIRAVNVSDPQGDEKSIDDIDSSLHPFSSSVASDAPTELLNSSQEVTIAVTSSSPPTATSSDRLLFVYNGIPLRVLADTGADISLIDTSLVSQLNIPTQSKSGSLRLAHRDSVIPRVGATLPLEMCAMFTASRRDDMRASVSFTHSFELMPLEDQHYDIILGTDLIPTIFGDSIPTRYIMRLGVMPPTTQCRAVRQADAASTAADVPLAATVADEPPLPTEYSDSSETLPVIYTTPELEITYAAQRDKLHVNADIIQALKINEAISSFCTVPEATLLFQVDPTMEDKLFRKQYPCAQSMIPLVTAKVQAWFDTGRICYAPPGCKYNNPLHVVPKKDDLGNMTDVRPVLDTRILNGAILSKDVFALPHIRQSLEKFSGMSIFGEFDLSEAYLQFKLHPDVQPYTAFTWQGVQYMFVGCPFGLAILPSHFQRIMSSIFEDMGFTFPYLDNLPFASSSWDEHLTQALAIINRLNEVNLRIKPSSVKFGHSHMKCLGHLLCAAGVGIDPKKLDAIKDWPRPKTGDELYTFLGFCTFLRDHIRHFADLTGPLEAVKNQKLLAWTDTLIHCYDTTKAALLRAPFLQYPDFSKPFHIAVDASNTGVGGVLYQPKSVDEHVTAHNMVAICSKKLNVSQRNYSPYKKELWGLVYCLRKFRHYVWGRTDLKIITDHKPLSFLLSSPNIANAVQLWLDVILDFHFTVEHRPGILNVLPDALSRMYACTYKDTWGIPSHNVTFSSLMGERSAVVHHSADTKGLILASSVSSTNPPEAPGPKVFALSQVSDADTDSSNLLVEMEKRGVTIPPSPERLTLITDAHALGHFGREAVFRSLWNKKLWWPGIRNDISKVIDECIPCARFTVVKSGYDPASYVHATGPWEHIQIDNCVHLPPSPDGLTTMFVVVDVFTGFVFLRALKSTASDEVARHLWDIFSVMGFPKIVQSDNGPEFVSDVMRAFAKLTGVDHRFISPYNPRADGKVERTIGTVTMVIKKLLHGTDHHWPLFVPFAQYSYNVKVSSLTGSSPFALTFGRNPNDIKDYTSTPASTINLDDWKSHQLRMLSVILPAVNDRILLAKDKMVNQLNQSRRLVLTDSLPTGATVMLKDPNGNRPKFEPKYLGPYTIVRRARNGAYVLKDLIGDLLDRHVPIDQLKVLSKTKRAPVASDSALDDSVVYEVDHIVSHQGDPGHYEYLVRWKNFTSADDTWEPQANFHDDEVIRNYWRGQGLLRAKRRPKSQQ
jgi:hypothetical protein